MTIEKEQAGSLGRMMCIKHSRSRRKSSTTMIRGVVVGVLASIALSSVVVQGFSPFKFGCNRYGKQLTNKDSQTSLQQQPLFCSNSNNDKHNDDVSNNNNAHRLSTGQPCSTSTASLLLAATLVLGGQVANAVSGGGLDYAGLDISNQNFSKGNYAKKDFSQVIAKFTDFSGSNLIGARFYKAFLVETNFQGADLRGASLEDTSMDNADLTNANLSGAYFSASLLDAKSLKGADLTDAQLPPKLLPRICDKDNGEFASGTNPTTGIDTRDSLMCP